MYISRVYTRTTSATFLNEEGIEQSIEVCTGIPEIVTSTEALTDMPGTQSIELHLDLTTCEVSVSELVSAVVNESVPASRPQ